MRRARISFVVSRAHYLLTPFFYKSRVEEDKTRVLFNVSLVTIDIYLGAHIPDNKILIITSCGKHHLSGMGRQSPQLTFAMAKHQRSWLGIGRFLIDLKNVGSFQANQDLSLQTNTIARSNVSSADR